MQRLPDPHLTPHGCLFPHRSPRQSSANAAEGGLKPPPAGRLRRAINPSSPIQHRDQLPCYIRQPPALVAHVGWPGGIAPPGSRRSRRDSLPSPGSSPPYCQNPWTHRHCAKNRGYWRVCRPPPPCAFFKRRSRLTFFPPPPITE